MTKRLLILAAMLGATLAFMQQPLLAHAVNVDCAKVSRPDENRIGSEVALSKLDDEFGNRELLPPPLAEQCALRLEFALNGNLNVYVREAKKKACDKFRTLAGVYARDYFQVPVQ